MSLSWVWGVECKISKEPESVRWRSTQHLRLLQKSCKDKSQTRSQRFWKPLFDIKTKIYKLLWKYNTWPASCFKNEEKPELCKWLLRRGVHKLVQEKKSFSSCVYNIRIDEAARTAKASVTVQDASRRRCRVKVNSILAAFIAHKTIAAVMHIKQRKIDVTSWSMIGESKTPWKWSRKSLT